MIKTQTRPKEKPVSLKEEEAAALLEQERPTRPITPTVLELVKRRARNQTQIKVLQAEDEVTKVAVIKLMDKHNVDVLTYKGVAVVSRDEFNKDSYEFDEKSFAKAHPKLYKKFLKKKEVSKRMSWKKLLGFDL